MSDTGARNRSFDPRVQGQKARPGVAECEGMLRPLPPGNPLSGLGEREEPRFGILSKAPHQEMAIA